jgi:hypothetical protein
MKSCDHRAAALQAAYVKMANRESRALEEHDDEEGQDSGGVGVDEDICDEQMTNMNRDCRRDPIKLRDHAKTRPF